MAPVTKRPTDNMARQIVVRSITAQDIVGFIDRMFLGDDFFQDAMEASPSDIICSSNGGPAGVGAIASNRRYSF